MFLNAHIPGGYAFLPADDVYSGGVRTLPGYSIARVLIAQPIPLEQAIPCILSYLAVANRPSAALCGIELRIPVPLSSTAFRSMNKRYTTALCAHGLLVDGYSPITRTTVVPITAAPPIEVLHAFTFTLVGGNTRPGFVTAGNGELRPVTGQAGTIVHRNDHSRSGMSAKASYVLGALSSTLEALGVTWSEATDLTIYASAPWSHVLEEQILPLTGKRVIEEIRWVYSTPPLQDMAFEMDVRGIAEERRLSDIRHAQSREV